MACHQLLAYCGNTGGPLAGMLRKGIAGSDTVADHLNVLGAGGAGTLAVVEGAASLILREVLASIYDGLGLDCLGDGTFRALVLARVIEPASKLDTIRVLTEIGVASPHRVRFMRCRKRVVRRYYRA